MIEDIAFVFMWALMPIAWQRMMKHANISIYRISIPAMAMISIYTFQYIGFPILYFELDEYRRLFVRSTDVIWVVYAFSSITITMLLTGYISARTRHGLLYDRSRYFVRYKHATTATKAEELLVLTLYFVSLIVLIMYVQAIGINNVAFISVIGEKADMAADQLRSAMGNEFSGKYHWYKLFMRDLMSISVFAMFAIYLTRPGIRSLLAFVIMLISAMFSMLSATEKGPVLWLLIGLGFVYLIVRRNGYISKPLLITGIPILFAFMGLTVYFFVGTVDLITAVQLALSRLFTGQLQGLYHYIEIFPDQVGFLYGLSFPNPGGLLPFTPYNLPVEVMNTVMPYLSDRNVVGSMPTFFWGEMYANFGIIGVLLPPFFVGYLLYLINTLMVRLRPTPLMIGMLVWLILHFKDLSGTGLSAYIVDSYLWPIVAIIITGMFLIGGGAIRLRRGVLRDDISDSSYKTQRISITHK